MLKFIEDSKNVLIHRVSQQKQSLTSHVKDGTPCTAKNMQQLIGTTKY